MQSIVIFFSINQPSRGKEAWLKKLGGPEADAYREALGGSELTDLPAAEDAPGPVIHGSPWFKMGSL